jgi:hypothetical protein
LFVVGIPSNPPCDAPKTITQLQYHLVAVSNIDEIPQRPLIEDQLLKEAVWYAAGPGG